MTNKTIKEAKEQPVSKEVTTADFPPTKTVYLLDPETGEFFGEYEAHQSPLEPGEYHAPEHSTDIEPPKPNKGCVLVFINPVWEQVQDPRGVWYDENNQMLEVTDLKKSIPGTWSRNPVEMKLTEGEKAQREIKELEGSITSRRVREAVLGIDDGWMQAINKKIETLRKKLA